MDTNLVAESGNLGETRLEWLPGADAPSQITRLSSLGDSPIDLMAANPIRMPAFYRGQSSKPGYYWMASLSRHVTYESKAERLYLMELDWAGTATHVLPQPFRLHFPRDARPYRHIPDFLAHHKDAPPEVVDVKGVRQQQKPLNTLTFNLTREACEELGFTFTLHGGSTTITAANLSVLAGYRGPGAATLDGYLPLLVDEVAGGEPTVAEVIGRVARTGVVPAIASAVVWRAMWLRLISTDFLSPLTGQARVRLGTSSLSLGGAA